jgi:hypothetical protein
MQTTIKSIPKIVNTSMLSCQIIVPTIAVIMVEEETKTEEYDQGPIDTATKYKTVEKTVTIPNAIPVKTVKVDAFKLSPENAKIIIAQIMLITELNKNLPPLLLEKSLQ